MLGAGKQLSRKGSVSPGGQAAGNEPSMPPLWQRKPTTLCTTLERVLTMGHCQKHGNGLEQPVPADLLRARSKQLHHFRN